MRSRISRLRAVLPLPILALLLALLACASGLYAARTPEPAWSRLRPGPAREIPANPKAPKPTERTARAELQRRMDAVADSLYRRTDLYWHKGDYDSVAYLLEQVVALNPNDVTSWGLLAWVDWACLNDEARAERTLKNGLALNPRRYELHGEWGAYLYRRRRYGEAASAFAKAVSFLDAPALTWNQYAHSLERMGHPDRAAKVWRHMETRFPGNPHSAVNRARLERKGLLNPAPASSPKAAPLSSPKPKPVAPPDPAPPSSPVSETP